MKKIGLTLLMIVMLLLSACAGQAPALSQASAPSATTSTAAAEAATAVPASAAAAVELTTTYENAVSVELQLLFGTLKLAETDQALTQAQAATLLPLWNSLKTLSQSLAPAQGAPGQNQDQATAQPAQPNSETQTQIDNLVKQIMAALTPAQITAITQMQITQETIQAIVADQGLQLGGTQQGGGNPPQNGNQPPQGTPPAGGKGGQQTGNGQPPSGGQPPADGRQAAGGMVPPEFFDVLIQSLEKISGTQATSATTTTSSTGTTNAAPPPGTGSGATDATAGLSTATGAYQLDGQTATQADQTYTATQTDQSGVYVLNGGQLTLTNATVTTSGNTSSDENSSFYGLNAGVLAASGSTIAMTGGTISTTGTGANGAFATGQGSTVNLTNVTINATGDGGHGIMATQGGAMTLTNVNMTTSGAHSAPLATDRGGGTITATGGVLTTTGQDSPCYYSTGLLEITNSTCNALGSEVAVIEGANTVNLTDSTTTSSVAQKWAVMIYQSFSGDAQGSDGVFNMTRGSLAYTDTTGPLFYVTNTNGHITLKGVAIDAASGILVKAEGNDRWGTSGSNGGTVILVADGQILTGNFIADKISSITATLQNSSTLTGAINAENSAKAVNLTLDASSTWNVTADSHLTCLTDPAITGTTISNLLGNGHTVTYDPSACSALNGQTYTLNGGGTLKPSN